MGPYCLLGIVCFDLMQGKKVHGADLQSLSFLDNFGNGVAKSGRRHSKQKEHKQLLWVYCATDADCFSFQAFEINKSLLIIKQNVFAM